MNSATEQTDAVATDTRRAVKVAFLQAAVLIPGGITEATFSAAKIQGVKLYWIAQEGLIIEYKGYETLVPSTNIKNVTFA